MSTMFWAGLKPCSSTMFWSGLKPCSSVDVGVPSSYSWLAQLQAFLSFPLLPLVFDNFRCKFSFTDRHA